MCKIWVPQSLSHVRPTLRFAEHDSAYGLHPTVLVCGLNHPPWVTVLLLRAITLIATTVTCKQTLWLQSVAIIGRSEKCFELILFLPSHNFVVLSINSLERFTKAQEALCYLPFNCMSFRGQIGSYLEFKILVFSCTQFVGSRPKRSY